MKTFKKVLSIIMIAALIASVFAMTTLSSGATATGAGLAEWALNAYYSGWQYVWGGASPGAVDCSGLIYSYCGGNRTSMLADAKANGRAWGYVSNGIPRVHGLGLARTGHVGVYIADGMEVDARGSQYGVCYQAIGGYNNWDCWFKLTAVSYPTNGWEQFNGKSYYYENGEYIVSTTRTIDGVTYTFNSSGACTASENASDVSEDTSNDNSDNSGSTADADDNGPLKRGSSGPRVEKLQSRLQELGYYNGPIDGDFGELTEDAFKLFQKTAGLYVDGIAGSDTELLYSDDAPAYVPEEDTDESEDDSLAETGAAPDAEDEAPAENEVEEADVPETSDDSEISFSLGDYADEVALIQERLNTLGYLEEEPDGEFGEQTETAVKEFQNNNNLVDTGIVDEVTYEVLFSDEAIEMAGAVTAAESKVNTPSEKRVSTSNMPVQMTPAASAAPNTEIEQKTAAVTSKSLAGVTDSIDLQKNAKSTNFEFILWLAVMIVVMLITFTIVYSVEKKKQRAAARSRRFYDNP